MSDTLSRLFVRIGADTSEFQKNMQGVQNRAQELSRNIGAVGGTMTKWVTGPMAIAGGALVGMAKKTANYGEEVLMMAEKTGMSVEGFQEMDYALKQLGFDGAEKALGRLNQRIGRAAEGNEKYAEALEKLNVPMDRVRDGTISTEEAMTTAIESLRGMDNEQRQAAVASELFGTRLSRDLMPALRDSEASVEELMQEARDLGIVMDEESAVASEKFNDKLHQLQEQFSAMVREIGTKVIPILMDVFIPIIQDSIIPAVLTFVEGLAGLLEAFSALPGPVQNIALALGGLLMAAGPVLLIVSKMIAAFSTIAPVMTTAGGVISGIALGPIAILAGAVAGIILVFRNWETIVDIVKWVAEAVTTAIGWWVEKTVEAFSWMYDNTIGIFESMWQGIKQVINWIIGGINKMINALNKISIDVPDWVPGFGGATWGFDIANVPELAEGGRIDIGGSAIVGEEGPELVDLPSGATVTPLSADKSVASDINMDIDYNVVDKATAEYANNDLLRKLKARGIGGAFR